MKKLLLLTLIPSLCLAEEASMQMDQAQSYFIANARDGRYSRKDYYPGKHYKHECDCNDKNHGARIPEKFRPECETCSNPKQMRDMTPEEIEIARLAMQSAKLLPRRRPMRTGRNSMPQAEMQDEVQTTAIEEQEPVQMNENQTVSQEAMPEGNLVPEAQEEVEAVPVMDQEESAGQMSEDAQ